MRRQRVVLEGNGLVHRSRRGEKLVLIAQCDTREEDLSSQHGCCAEAINKDATYGKERHDNEPREDTPRSPVERALAY